MRGNKENRNLEDEEYEEEGPSSIATTNNTNKDGKNIDKVNAMRSKHSVTEQRRRSKINERFQILRDLIPHSDQKRDTASFLLEVIEYVQYLQEKVQKYEGSYQGWGADSTKLIPWRNSHWRVQSFGGSPNLAINGSTPGPTYQGKFDGHSNTFTPAILTSVQNQVELDPSRDVASRTMEQQSELSNKTMPHPVNFSNIVANPLQRPVSGAQPADYSITNDPLIHSEELTIEGGTISISSVYSEGLLNTLTQALQTAGIDLAQANISVQIDIGNRANRRLTSTTPVAKDFQNQGVANLRDHSSGEESDPAQKRKKHDTVHLHGMF